MLAILFFLSISRSVVPDYIYHRHVTNRHAGVRIS
jgi:hypothetical protein